MMMLVAQIYVLICTLLLAHKDAMSYLLKDKNSPDTAEKLSIISKWHRDGFLMNALFVIPVFALSPALSWIILYSILIRLAVFDVAFNYWARLDYRHIGTTATTDKFFSKIVGEKGAIKKSLFFLIVTVVLSFVL
jgi:hypothetical protein